ncbi:MAG: ABC transporter ATP-binding protein [Deinococcales bacterium]
MSAIEASRLSKRYGRRFAVKDLNFKIGQGEIVGFLGPNGAGKTTTLRMLAGLIRPSQGECRILARPSPSKELREVGTMIEEPSFYPYLTGKGNLNYAAKLHGGVKVSRIDEVLSFVHMENASHKKVKAYSQGMRQRLGLARALLWKPKILLLDEPTNGLDPVGIAEFRESLRQIAKEEGVTILISSHILAEIEKLVSRVLVIERGELLYDGRLADLTRQLGDKTSYRLLATDQGALEKVLSDLGFRAELLNSGYIKVEVSSEQKGFLSGLAHVGIDLIEASRESESLEGAYLRLLKEDGRPV